MCCIRIFFIIALNGFIFNNMTIGCQDGFYGDGCDKSCASDIPNCEICYLYTTPNLVLSCNMCTAKYYGTNCTSRCSSNCKDDVCDKLNGKCFLGCKPGFLGNYCNETCSENCEGNKECNQTNGDCVHGCKDGFYGPKCKQQCSHNCSRNCNRTSGMCFGCKTGSFGELCDSMCHLNCINNSCNQDNGFCDNGCDIGYYDNFCNISCNSNCAGNGSCIQDTGYCKSGCKKGYYGGMCEKTCQSTCKPEGLCNREHGTCDICSDGFYGDKCQHACPLNCKNGMCKQSDGICQNGCDISFYGNFCNISCSVNCAGNKSCIQENGKCAGSCKIGYYGDNCTQVCPSNCKPEGVCHREEGTCGNTCSDTYYGEECQHACPVHCLENICTKNTGHCDKGCKSGFYGSMCIKVCECGGAGCQQDNGVCLKLTGPSTEIWLIVVISLVCFVILFAIVLVCILRRRAVKEREFKGENALTLEIVRHEHDQNFYVDHRSSKGRESTYVVKDVVAEAGMLIPRTQIIDDSEVLGRGNFAEVRKATFVGAFSKEHVAVKSIQSLHTPKDFQDFQKELKIIRSIGNHPNVVSLKGFCIDEGTNYIGAVLEFCPNGDLRTYLRKLKSPGDLDAELQALVLKQFVKFSIDIASGMDHISRKGIIHRDLAARNVLLDGNLVAKISDFGLSRAQNIYTVSDKEVHLPIKWMALESLKDCVYSSASDVWSFGVVLWEIFSVGATPFSYDSPSDVVSKLDNGERLQKPEGCDNEIYGLMLECWIKEPHHRPSFESSRERLSNHMDKIMGEDYQVIPGAETGDYDKINEAVIQTYERLVDRDRISYTETTYTTPGIVMKAQLRDKNQPENGNNNSIISTDSYLKPQHATSDLSNADGDIGTGKDSTYLSPDVELDF